MFSTIVDVLGMLGILLPVAIGFVLITPFGWVFLAVTVGVSVFALSQVKKRKKLSLGEMLLLVAWFLYSLGLFFWLALVFWGWADGAGTQEEFNWYLKWNIGCLAAQLLSGLGIAWAIGRDRG